MPILPDAPAAILDDLKLAEHAIDVLPNAHAEAIDRVAQSVVFKDALEFRYSKLLLATGASLRRLDVEGGSGDGVLDLRTFSDALRLAYAIETRPVTNQ